MFICTPKKRHLSQLIESLISTEATSEQAVGLMTHIADHFQLSLDQVSECARLLAGKTAKGDGDSLTAETTVTLGQLKAALGICNDCSKQSLGESVVGKSSSSQAKAQHEQQQLLLP